MQHSTRYTIIFAAILCVVCSVIVSSSAVGLRERQDRNKLIDLQKKVEQTFAVEIRYQLPFRSGAEEARVLPVRTLDTHAREFILRHQLPGPTCECGGVLHDHVNGEALRPRRLIIVAHNEAVVAPAKLGVVRTVIEEVVATPRRRA